MKWYPFLNPQGEPKNKGKSLNENVTIEKNNIIVCQKLKYLSFGCFPTYLDFVKFMLTETPLELRCFYELIPGNVPQKPYFDIEFFTSNSTSEPEYVDGHLVLPENEADEAIRELVSLIQREIPPLHSNKSHILVFTSHKDNKRSYHIVVEGFYFSDNKSNKLFSEKIRKNMKQSWQGIIDTSMYKSMQQFRIAGCCKYETSRFKVISKELTVNGCFNSKISNGWIPKIEPESENHKTLLLIEASLITQVSGSQMLPALLDDKEQSSEFLSSGERKEYSEFFEPLTSENIKEALTLCYKVAGLEYGDPRFPYSYMRTVEDNGESSIILLKRRFASMCRICNRPHENENPFLIIAGIERDIYLDCRRNEKGKKFYVGKLGPSEKGKTIITKTFQSIGSNELIPEGPKICIKIPGTPEVKESIQQKMEINIADITNNLATISQKVAPKIKIKDVKPIDKESVKLNFKL
jgi:hypothetical protein